MAGYHIDWRGVLVPYFTGYAVVIGALLDSEAVVPSLVAAKLGTLFDHCWDGGLGRLVRGAPLTLRLQTLRLPPAGESCILDTDGLCPGVIPSTVVTRRLLTELWPRAPRGLVLLVYLLPVRAGGPRRHVVPGEGGQEGG